MYYNSSLVNKLHTWTSPSAVQLALSMNVQVFTDTKNYVFMNQEQT